MLEAEQIKIQNQLILEQKRKESERLKRENEEKRKKEEERIILLDKKTNPGYFSMGVAYLSVTNSKARESVRYSGLKIDAFKQGLEAGKLGMRRGISFFIDANIALGGLNKSISNPKVNFGVNMQLNNKFLFFDSFRETPYMGEEKRHGNSPIGSVGFSIGPMFTYSTNSYLRFDFYYRINLLTHYGFHFYTYDIYHGNNPNSGIHYRSIFYFYQENKPNFGASTFGFNLRLKNSLYFGIELMTNYHEKNRFEESYYSVENHSINISNINVSKIRYNHLSYKVGTTFKNKKKKLYREL